MKNQRQSLCKFVAYTLLGTTFTLDCQLTLTAQRLR